MVMPNCTEHEGFSKKHSYSKWLIQQSTTKTLYPSNQAIKLKLSKV